MRQFVTEGTGSSQVLDEVPNETIKIYATEADLDADLANLEENEIVATDEDNNPASGTQYPVDVVQDGNMNAVTSNAVAESLSYSTTEQATGGYWIDGKPIYRKVIEVAFSPNVSYTKTVSTEAGNSTYQVVNTSTSVVVGSFGTRQPWQDTKAGNIKTTAYMSNGSMLFTTEHQAGTAYLVCEYTKATD